MTFITKQQLREHLLNAPSGTTPGGIVASLRAGGATIEGDPNPIQQQGGTEPEGLPGRIATGIKGATKGVGLEIDVTDAARTFQTGVQREIGQAQESFARLPQRGTSLTDVITTPIAGAAQVIGETAFTAAGDILSSITPDAVEGTVKKVLSSIGGAILGTERGQMITSGIAGLVNGFEQLKIDDPAAAQKLDNAFGITELATAFVGGPIAGKAITKGGKAIATKSVVKKAAVKEVLEEGSAKAIRQAAEEAAPKVSFTERLAGVRPDIKKRIAGKRDKLDEFFDVSAARNVDDTLPTPLEHAARNVESARDSLQGVLNDTGGRIGQFRKKVSTLQASSDQMAKIEQSFVSSLDDLNLSIKNGKIGRKAGKVAGGVSEGDVKALQGMFDDLLIVKGAPSSQNLIDLRNAASQRINFGKRAAEVSNAIDPVSRKLRSAIRDANIQMIGKEQAALLDEYSDLISLLGELNTVVDSKSGGEFLLKRVLSERGRIPREMLDRLKEATGIDLMDDAVMAQLATEITGNAAQKGLFRQEITKAGLTGIIDLVSGSPGGAIRATKKVLPKVKGIIAPVEETFLKAAN